jgi:hypothetical protein
MSSLGRGVQKTRKRSSSRLDAIKMDALFNEMNGFSVKNEDKVKEALKAKNKKTAASTQAKIAKFDELINMYNSRKAIYFQVKFTVEELKIAELTFDFKDMLKEAKKCFETMEEKPGFDGMINAFSQLDNCGLVKYFTENESKFPTRAFFDRTIHNLNFVFGLRTKLIKYMRSLIDESAFDVFNKYDFYGDTEFEKLSCATTNTGTQVRNEGGARNKKKVVPKVPKTKNSNDTPQVKKVVPKAKSSQDKVAAPKVPKTNNSKDKPSVKKPTEQKPKAPKAPKAKK